MFVPSDIYYTYDNFVILDEKEMDLSTKLQNIQNPWSSYIINVRDILLNKLRGHINKIW